MSRLEKKEINKSSKNKYRKTCRWIFMVVMLLITTSSVLWIDYEANRVLDDDSKNNLVKYIMDIF